MGFRGGIATDPSKPEGTPRKLLGMGRLKGVGWKDSTPVDHGIAATWRWFLAHQRDHRQA